MFKIRKHVFSKLYRYYCRKMLGQWWIILLMFLYSLFLMRGATGFLGKMSETKGWKEYLVNFWLVSLLQAGGLFIIISQLITKLLGLYVDYFGGFRRFKNYTKNNADDITVLIFTSGITRETVMAAKYIAIFTYFFSLNFLLFTLPLAFYFLFSLSLPVILTFLLLNGLIFVLVNFLLIVPYLFYLYEDYSFLSFFFPFVIILAACFSAFFFRETILQYPLFFFLLHILLSVLVAYLFFSLYRKKFLEKDLA